MSFLKNICYIISGIDKAVAFEWICEHLDKTKYTLHFVLLHSRKSDFEAYLEEASVPHVRFHYEGKRHLAAAVARTYSYLKKHRIVLVHAHLLDAGLVGSMAATLARVPLRIYTRHYSSYHHVYHRKGVMYDKLINRLSTRIVAVSEVVRTILVDWENVSPGKVMTIPHGFLLKAFAEKNDERVISLKKKYQLEHAHPIIGVVSRYTSWKGIQFILPAFGNILERYPDAVLVLANAKGEFQIPIQRLLSAFPERNYREIAFENDLYSLFQSFDIFIHCPIDWHSEAFGQVYIEALATGIPSIFTVSGIGNEIAKDGENCLVVGYQDTNAIHERLMQLLQDPSLREKLAVQGPYSLSSQFELDRMILDLENLYD